MISTGQNLDDWKEKNGYFCKCVFERDSSKLVYKKKLWPILLNSVNLVLNEQSRRKKGESKNEINEKKHLRRNRQSKGSSKLIEPQVVSTAFIFGFCTSRH